jgi:hypothetical protein
VCKVAEQQVVLHALVEHALKVSHIKVGHHSKGVCKVAPDGCITLTPASLQSTTRHGKQQHMRWFMTE